MKFKYSDFELIKKIALQFPGAEESVSHEQTSSITVNYRFVGKGNNQFRRNDIVIIKKSNSAGNAEGVTLLLLNKQ